MNLTLESAKEIVVTAIRHCVDSGKHNPYEPEYYEAVGFIKGWDARGKADLEAIKDHDGECDLDCLPCSRRYEEILKLQSQKESK